MHSFIAWAIAAVLAGLGGWVIALNYAVFYRQFFRRRHHSWIPLIGGFVGVFAMLACPLPAVRRLAWLPLILDPGCVFGLLYSIIMLVLMLILPSRARPAARSDESF